MGEYYNGNAQNTILDGSAHWKRGFIPSVVEPNKPIKDINEELDGDRNADMCSTTSISAALNVSFSVGRSMFCFV